MLAANSLVLQLCAHLVVLVLLLWGFLLLILLILLILILQRGRAENLSAWRALSTEHCWAAKLAGQQSMALSASPAAGPVAAVGAAVVAAPVGHPQVGAGPLKLPVGG